MQPYTLSTQSSISIAVLVKQSSFRVADIEANYFQPLLDRGLTHDKLMACALPYGANNKVSAPFIKDVLQALLSDLKEWGVTHLYVTDAAYFKILVGQAKAEPHHGHALPCKIKGHEDLTVVLGLNYQQLIYNPELQARHEQGLQTLAASYLGTYQKPGTGIIHAAAYPKTTQEIAQALESLHSYPRLTCDLETFSLRFDKAGIGTIAFAWDQHHGLAFACDYFALPAKTADGEYGQNIPNVPVRLLLREFFETYQGELIFHNAAFDVKCLITGLWMENLLDQDGLLRGLEILGAKLHDTKLIAYLATNSTAGNRLGLKYLAQEFAGDWGTEEIKDIKRIPLPELLQYNLVDTLSTWFVYDKYTPIMEADQQGDLYRGLFLDSLRLIIQLELTGMPMSKSRIQEVKAKLESALAQQLLIIRNSPPIHELNERIRYEAWEKDWEARKNKAKNPLKIKAKELTAFDGLEFNPNSGPQLQKLLYEFLKLPVIDLTESKAPATGADTLEKLSHHTKDPHVQELLQAFANQGTLTKVLGTFIAAFEEAVAKDDSDTVWLHGNFNLGGTVSGRLSSSDPNLQNIPAGNTGSDTKKYCGKLIKSCFVGPQDWLFAGADFNSLEDYISALTTKDKNKLSVYERGFDGHSLRAAYYFRDQLPHIDLDDPDSVNSIKSTHPLLRQESKPPTFLLTYGGTYHGMMSNLGWTKEKSQAIEANYHELYKVSDAYVQARLNQASKDGFVEVAFGLRVRTPLLKQVIFGSKKMPYEAAAEGRTAGNALGQSYGLLNNRAAVAFFKKVWASKYRTDILPVALIHDAIYILIRNDVEVVAWANTNLIKEMQWQELPEIQHPTVKLGANLDLFWPSWAEATTLPNKATEAELYQLCIKEHHDHES